MWILAVAAVGAIVLPIASAGCGRSACIVYSKAEYDQRASCPLRKDALPYFTDSSCPGPVVSVDGEGVFSLNASNADESLCCYPVTQQDLELDDQRIDCLGPDLGGSGGVGGIGGGVTVGTGGVGGGLDACFTCGQAFGGVLSADPTFLCSASIDAWFALQSCACAAGMCASACELSFCHDEPVTDECVACVSNTTECADALATCNFN